MIIKCFDRFRGNNFDEAIANMSECFKTDDLPENLINVFANVDKEDRSNNQSFWLFVEALQVFYQKFKRLPLSGVVPDMVSTTENYLALQRIYIE